MFFIKLGNVIAWVGLVFGAMNFAGALFALNFVPAEDFERYSLRYFGSTPVGEHLDTAIMMIVASIILGLLVQIAKNTAK